MTTRLLCACLAGAGLIAPLQAQTGRGCQNAQAAEEMGEGVGAFKQAEYAKAAEHFQSAVQLDPGCTDARLYLGAAYMQQYIPGAKSADNLGRATAATKQFE